MDERPTKRRGPLLWIAERSPRLWIAAAVMLPLLYILSLPLLGWIEQQRWVPQPGTFEHQLLFWYVSPVLFAMENAPPPIPDWIVWYVSLLA